MRPEDRNLVKIDEDIVNGLYHHPLGVIRGVQDLLRQIDLPPSVLGLSGAEVVPVVETVQSELHRTDALPLVVDQRHSAGDNVIQLPLDRFPG